MNTILSTNVTVMIADMDKAIEFYTVTLGLKPGIRYGNHWAEVEAPGITIGLHPRSEKVSTGNNLSIGFGTKQFDETISALEQKGITFHIDKGDWSRRADFTDPDGNAMYFIELK